MNGVVNIHGKEYSTVAKRVNDFRAEHPDWTIQSNILSVDEKTVIVRAEILNNEGRVIASGLAEESRTASPINKTSAVENCETSAVGRALAFYGLAGSEIASADEVAGAIAREGSKKVSPKDVDLLFAEIAKYANDHQELIDPRGMEALPSLKASAMKSQDPVKWMSDKFDSLKKAVSDRQKERDANKEIESNPIY